MTLLEISSQPANYGKAFNLTITLMVWAALSVCGSGSGSLPAKGLMDSGCDLRAIFTLSNHQGTDCFGLVQSQSPLPPLARRLTLRRSCTDWPSITSRDVIQCDIQVCPLDRASALSAVGSASMSRARQEIDPALHMSYGAHFIPTASGGWRATFHWQEKILGHQERLNLLHTKASDFLEVVCGIFLISDSV